MIPAAFDEALIKTTTVRPACLGKRELLVAQRLAAPPDPVNGTDGAREIGMRRGGDPVFHGCRLTVDPVLELTDSPFQERVDKDKEAVEGEPDAGVDHAEKRCPINLVTTLHVAVVPRSLQKNAFDQRELFLVQRRHLTERIAAMECEEQGKLHPIEQGVPCRKTKIRGGNPPEGGREVTAISSRTTYLLGQPVVMKLEQRFQEAHLVPEVVVQGGLCEPCAFRDLLDTHGVMTPGCKETESRFEQNRPRFHVALYTDRYRRANPYCTVRRPSVE